MRVAIVGAGALGTVYGARLARYGACEVTLVARSARPPAARRLELVGDGEAFDWEAPAQTLQVSTTADVVLLCVRYEELYLGAARAADVRAPIVVLTPMLPQDHARLSSSMPGRIVAAMPNAIAYLNDAGTIRYWLPRGASTFIESRATPGPEAGLVQHLERAGFRAKQEPDVLSRNVATTVSFVPLAMALDAAGGVDAALHDPELIDLALDAAAEGREIGRAVGRAEAWASTLLHFVGRRSLKLGVAIARARAPEAVAYAEEHFGRKLHQQNLLMAARIVELAHEKGLPSSAVARLRDRLLAKGDPPGT